MAEKQEASDWEMKQKQRPVLAVTAQLFLYCRERWGQSAPAFPHAQLAFQGAAPDGIRLIATHRLRGSYVDEELSAVRPAPSPAVTI